MDDSFLCILPANCDFFSADWTALLAADILRVGLVAGLVRGLGLGLGLGLTPFAPRPIFESPRLRAIFSSRIFFSCYWRFVKTASLYYSTILCSSTSFSCAFAANYDSMSPDYRRFFFWCCLSLRALRRAYNFYFLNSLSSNRALFCLFSSSIFDRSLSRDIVTCFTLG